MTEEMVVLTVLGVIGIGTLALGAFIVMLDYTRGQ